MLTGSGVDEAWATGAQLGEAVIELLRAGEPFTQEIFPRRTRSADGQAGWSGARLRQRTPATAFHGGPRGSSMLKGMIGMALAGLTGDGSP